MIETDIRTLLSVDPVWFGLALFTPTPRAFGAGDHVGDIHMADGDVTCESVSACQRVVCVAARFPSAVIPECLLGSALDALADTTRPYSYSHQLSTAPL